MRRPKLWEPKKKKPFSFDVAVLFLFQTATRSLRVVYSARIPSRITEKNDEPYETTVDPSARWEIRRS